MSFQRKGIPCERSERFKDMPNYHVSYIWSGKPTRSAGWTENFWLTTTDIGLAVDIATRSRLLNSMRLAHNSNVNLTDVRVSQIGDDRISRLTDVSTGPSVGTFSGEYPALALLLQFQAASGRTTRQWMKGIWDDISTDGGRYTNANDFNKVFKTMTNDIKSQFSVRTLAVNPKKFINTIDNTTGTFTSPGHGFAAGAHVRISSVRPQPRNYANKIWRLGTVTGDTFTVVGWAPPSGYVSNPLTAYARLQSYQFEVISDIAIMRISKRNVGRPFGALVGRAPRRR